MSILSENIRYLRAQKKYSQQKVADDLIITRARYSKYEDDASDPPLDILQRIAHYFHISIDILLSVDLRKIPMTELMTLSDNRILLPITVDRNGENFIEIIPHKAQAGYLTGYSDPEFIENLQHLSLPFLGSGKYRAFPVAGDSMPPHKQGSYIVGQYIENLGEVRDGRTYILLTKNEGIVYKRLNKNGKNSLMLHSDNTFYAPYQIKASEILEIWEYACSIATEEFQPDDLSPENLRTMFLELRRDLQEVKKKMG